MLLAATAGTARHSLVLEHALRPLFAYLRAIVVPTAVFAATEDFGSTAAGPLGERIDRAAAELAVLVRAGQGWRRARRGRRVRASATTGCESLPFDELLRRV